MVISLYSRSDSFLLTVQRPALEFDVVFEVVLCVLVIVVKWREPDEYFSKAYHLVWAAGSPC